MQLTGAVILFLSIWHRYQAQIIFGNVGNIADKIEDTITEDDWDSVYRVYGFTGWNTHDDYMSRERSALDGDDDESQFRSWKLDQWNHNKLQRVRVEIYDDGDEVAEFEFEGAMQNATGFFNFANLRRSSFDDLPDGISGIPFPGDDFSFDGDDDARHWTVSSRHTGGRNCFDDEGWFQVIDKPKPGRDRCICAYENVEKYPTIMYAKGGRKARWSDQKNVGYADMMQVSVSKKPYPRQPAPRPAARPQSPFSPQPLFQLPGNQIWMETKKKK